MKEKFKNRGLWVALFALLGMVLMDTVPHFNAGRYQEYVNIILVILVAAGVISNPTAGRWFTDEDKKEQEKCCTKLRALSKDIDLFYFY